MAKKKGKLSFGSLLYNNKFTLPFSIIIAVIIWITISINQNPIREQVFTDVTVNLSTEGTFAGMNSLDIISGGIGEKVNVRVSGPSYVISSLKNSDIYVTASLAQVNEPGTYYLDLVVSNNNNKNYNVLGITPRTIKVDFDYIDEKTFEVLPLAVGAVAEEGLIAESPVVSNIDFSTIVVTGPRSEIFKLASVQAVAQVNRTMSETESFEAEIKLIDNEGNVLDPKSFKLSFAKTNISVPIYKSKTVPIRADFKNMPTAYLKNNLQYTLSESEVKVIGPPEIIESVSEIKLSPIDFDSISSKNNSFDCELILPNAIKNVDNIETVTVKFDTSNIIEKTFTVKHFSHNLTNEYKINISSQLKNVVMAGPKSSINSITTDDLIGELDLTGKTSGENTVTVRIRDKIHNDVWQFGSYTILVKVTEG